LNQVPFATDEEQRTRERRRYGDGVVGWAVSDKDETSLENRETRAQAERRGSLKEQGGLSGRSDADDGGTGALDVLGIVKVRDQDVARVKNTAGRKTSRHKGHVHRG
jgi:hypothetical protein